MLRWLLSALHLLAFGIGLGAIWARARALREAADPVRLRGALQADTWWGIAALLWLGTGLPRLFGGLEKPPSYYLANHIFWFKLALFGLTVVLELGPAITLGRWRRTLARGQRPDASLAPRWARVSQLQIALLLIMLLAATAVARGFGG